MELALFIGGGIAVVLLIVVVANVAAKRRREAFCQIARELGFEYQDHLDWLPQPGMERLRLFRCGRGRRSRNILTGRYNGTSVTLFDYHYVTGSGKHRSTHSQFVAAFHLERIHLPLFALAPENIFDKLISMMGFQDIDFDHSPAFPAKYLLRGEDEFAVRSLFDGNLLDFFAYNLGWCVEGGDQWLIVYRTRRRVSPQEVTTFLEETALVHSAFNRK